MGLISYLSAWTYAQIGKKSSFLRNLYKSIAEEVSQRVPSGRILDAGTGPGYLPIEICRRNTSLEITGIDISPGMVMVATRIAKKQGVLGQVRFQVADVAKLPFKDEFFDLVVSSLSFHHWSKPAESLEEVFRVIKKGGEVWIYDIRKDTPKEAEEEYRRQYGLLSSLLFLQVVRAHSFVTKGAVEKILLSLSINPEKVVIEERGILLKMKVCK